MKRQTLPLGHIGTSYTSDGKGGFIVDQKDFVDKLRTHEIPKEWNDEDSLFSHQKDVNGNLHTAYRSILGALLWLCLTNLSLIADVIHLQCEVTAPLVKHLRSANKLVERAIKYRDSSGLHYPRLAMPARGWG